MLRFFNRLLNVANHAESSFGQIIKFAVENTFEATNSICQVDVNPWLASKDLGNVHWLREELSHFTRTINRQLVFFRQLIHTQNRDNIFQFFILLQHAFNALSNTVVLLTHDQRI